MIGADEEALQGAWTIISLEFEGRTVGEGAFSGSQIVMEEDRFTTVSMGANYGGVFELNTAAARNTIDMTFTTGPHAGMASLGIYELDGDALKICLGLAGRDRPKEFKTSPGSGHALETLLRDREAGRNIELAAPAMVENALSGLAVPSTTSQTDPDMAAIHGEWAMTLGEMDGHAADEAFVSSGKRIVKGSELTVSFGGQAFLKATVALDSASHPKAIDYTLLMGPNRGKQQFGIYEVDGESLRICFGLVGAARPTEFTTQPGDGRTLSAWKRTAK